MSTQENVQVVKDFFQQSTRKHWRGPRRWTRPGLRSAGAAIGLG